MQSHEHNVSYLEGWKKLSGSRVTVIGVGGEGGFAVQMLALMGVGRIRMVDGAYVQKSGLGREVFATKGNLGQTKVLAANRWIVGMNERVLGEPLPVFLDEDNCYDLVRGSDVVLDCLDDFSSKMILFKACAGEGVPLVTTVLAGTMGQVAVVLPGCGMEPGVLYEHICQEAGLTAFEGIKLPAPTGLITSLQVQETAKILTHAGRTLTDKTLFFDLGRNIFELRS